MNNDLISRAALPIITVKHYDSTLGGVCDHEYVKIEDVRNAPAVDAVSKAAYDDLYAKYRELAQLTNKETPKLMKLLQEFNDNAPPKKGEWIATSLDDADPYFICSVCRRGYSTIYHEGEEMNHCPNCGAKMDDEHVL